MENTIVEETKVVGKEIVKAPVEAGKIIVGGAEVVGHDIAKETVRGEKAVVGGTKSIASDVKEGGKQMGRDVKQAVSPMPDEPLKRSTTHDSVVPAV